MKFLLLLMAGMATIGLGFARINRTTSASASSTTATTAATHTISVGAAGFSFTPNSVTANPGDTVKFNFYPTNHSVARAEFRYPCIPYEYVETGRQGFYSGYEPVQAILNTPPSFSIEVNDTDPIFFYCTTPGACLDYVMIGVINPNETFTLATQKLFVENSTFELSPGEPFPTESPHPNPTMPGGYSPAIGTSPSSSSGAGSPLSAGAIAGIAIGGAVVVILAASLIYICGRKGGIERGYRHAVQPSTAAPVPKVDHTPGSATVAGYSIPPYNVPARADTCRSMNTTTSLGYLGRQVVSPQQAYHAGQRSPGTMGTGTVNPRGVGQGPRAYHEHPKPPSPPPQSPVELPANIDPVISTLPGYYRPRSPPGRGGSNDIFRRGR